MVHSHSKTRGDAKNEASPKNQGARFVMARGQHDTIAYRLSQILIKLNHGDHLDPSELAEEFGTHLRTIQRDLKVRLAHLPLLKTKGRYHLEPAYLGKLNFNDIERFAAQAGVKGLFPSLDRDFLKNLLGEQIPSPWLVRGHHYEDLSAQQDVFARLEAAVVRNSVLTLDMLKDGHVHTYNTVHPYRLINSKGIWYLAAVHDGRLKTFGIGKIRSVQAHAATFTRDARVDMAVQTEEGIWHSSQPRKVLLSVAPAVADYFKRRQLIPHQKIVGESADGTLTVETAVGHQNQILPIVRYWIPSVRIVSPGAWNDELISQLAAYLNAGEPLTSRDSRPPST